VLRWIPALILVSLLHGPGCRTSDTTVDFYFAEGYRFTPAERSRIERVFADTADEVRALLPSLPRGLRLLVRAGTDVIPETGETGAAILPATVLWTVDPHRDGGVTHVVDTELRASLFHEFHHLVRDASVKPTSLFDEAIAEGMASVFEDFAGPRRPWAAYGSEVPGWVGEMRALPPGTKRQAWFGRHPDGRRWIGHHVGAYIVDLAVTNAGGSAATLAPVPVADIVRLAYLEP
jgi:hypothetical protein